jgi:UDP-4-amino-4,6-dideoxy-N-acetyl-beta-L-altrosamine N-acetyltransferase
MSEKFIDYVRPMIKNDLEQVLTWRNHSEIRRYMLSPNQISLDEHSEWFDRASKDPARELLIFETNGLPLGFVQFKCNADSKVSDWGFYAAPDAPKGTGMKLGNVALNYAFSTLGLHKICGQALAFNKASIGFHKKLGFFQEAVLREHYKVNDVYQDLLCFGLLNREWKPL